MKILGEEGKEEKEKERGRDSQTDMYFFLYWLLLLMPGSYFFTALQFINILMPGMDTKALVTADFTKGYFIYSCQFYIL